jgi:hypothetical protein
VVCRLDFFGVIWRSRLSTITHSSSFREVLEEQRLRSVSKWSTSAEQTWIAFWSTPSVCAVSTSAALARMSTMVLCSELL